LAAELGAFRASYRIALGLVALGAALLILLFGISLKSFYQMREEGTQGLEGSLSELIRTVTMVIPLAVALAAASIILGKGLAVLLELRRPRGPPI